MANMSAIYEYLEVNPNQIPILWFIALLTRLLVQTIIEHMSDNTWCMLGRRHPFMFLRRRWDCTLAFLTSLLHFLKFALQMASDGYMLHFLNNNSAFGVVCSGVELAVSCYIYP